MHGETSAMGKKMANKRSTAFRLVRALALVSAAVQAPFADASANSGVNIDGAVTKEATAIRQLEADVKGHAQISDDNELGWNLHQLEPNTFGYVRIFAETSCNALGSTSLWDRGETSIDPWWSVHWKSDSNGRSMGHVKLDELIGAYPYPAYLGHAVAFYTQHRVLLACRVLEPEPNYKNYGVEGQLNFGLEEYQSKKAAGAIILNKNNTLSWRMYNLKADRMGQISVLAGRNCDYSKETWFTGTWGSNEVGVSSGELALDSKEHPFAELVGRAVAAFNSRGKVVVCGILSNFVDSTSTALDALGEQLNTISSIASYGQAIAGVEPVPELPYQCLYNAQETFAAAGRLNDVSAYLAQKKVTYNVAVNRISTSRAQQSLVSAYNSKQKQKRKEKRLIKQLERFWNKNCVATKACINFRNSLQKDETKSITASQKIAANRSKFRRAVKAVNEGTATPDQEALATEYHVLVNDIVDFEESFKERIYKIEKACLPRMKCQFFTYDESCSEHEAYNVARYDIATELKYGAKLDIKRSKLHGRYQAALASKRPSRKQRILIVRYGSMRLQKSKIFDTTARHLRNIHQQDARPRGKITLMGNNILSWQLDWLPAKNAGNIVIHNFKSCEEALGAEIKVNQMALQGTTPYENVIWTTQAPSNSNARFASSLQSVDLSELKGTLQFSDNYPRAVVVYAPKSFANSTLVPFSCGVLTLQ